MHGPSLCGKHSAVGGNEACWELMLHSSLRLAFPKRDFLFHINRKHIHTLLKIEKGCGLQNLIVCFRCQASLSFWKKGTYRPRLLHNGLLSSYHVYLVALSTTEQGDLFWPNCPEGFTHSHDRCFYFTFRLLWKALAWVNSWHASLTQREFRVVESLFYG